MLGAKTRARGFSFALPSFLAARTKNEAGRFNIVQPQIQARPCLIVLAARPGNLPGRSFSFSGTECFSFRTIHGGEWLRETRFQGLLLFWGPAKQDFSKTRREKNIDCRRTRLQIDCDLFGLEGYQGHIKVLH
ncbi:MAG TPA: hypothetical protein VE054_15050, partial [Blattabacteriaceae bacterium]|nr:hypothetical protein [Blattabacteriaceae bacterium]